MCKFYFKSVDLIKSEEGLSLLEYAIVVGILATLLFSYSNLFTPKSSQFYSDVIDGLDQLYPQGYYQS
jgi:hypothetical protein